MKKSLLIISVLLTSTLLFADNYSRANNIVTNHDKGLQWQDQPYTTAAKNAYNSLTVEAGRSKKWIHAQAYCKSLDLDGSGWRLPTKTELGALVDKSQKNPAINPIFQNALGLGTWTGTTYPDNTAQAWGMGFAGGHWHHCTKTSKSKLIMCVRSAKASAPATPSNTPPSAKTGPDQSVIEGDTVTLDGSGSTDTDGTITAYVWKKNGTVLSRDVSFNRLFSIGTHTITLTVTDNDAAIKSDNITIVVKAVEAPVVNKALIADAGEDQTVEVGDTVTITESGSDADGTIVSYEWKTGNTIVSTDASFDYTPTATGTDTLTLTVTDDEDATGTDSMNVTVTAANTIHTTNTAPTAHAGADQSVNEGDTIIFDGFSSSDLDGIIVSYEWKKGSVILSTSESFDKSNFGAGAHTIILTVTDNDGKTGTDSVTIIVEAESSYWYTVSPDSNIYTAGNSTVETINASLFDIITTADMITFTKDCLSIDMKSNGDITTGYTGNCDTKEGLTTGSWFAAGTAVSIQSDDSIIIDVPLTADLTFGS